MDSKELQREKNYQIGALKVQMCRPRFSAQDLGSLLWLFLGTYLLAVIPQPRLSEINA